MDHSSETANLDQTDEDILITTVSDEALEAAAGAESGASIVIPCSYGTCTATTRVG
jgi:hypothetical protein